MTVLLEYLNFKQDWINVRVTMDPSPQPFIMEHVCHCKPCNKYFFGWNKVIVS